MTCSTKNLVFRAVVKIYMCFACTGIDVLEVFRDETEEIQLIKHFVPRGKLGEWF